MSIKYRCPGCGQVGKAGDEAAGQKVACASCGKRLQIPGTPAAAAAAVPAAPATSATATIPFRCDSCGASFSAPARLAGRKVKCSKCGLGTRVPGEPVPVPLMTIAAAPAAPKAKPSPKPAAVEPPPVDIFGFDELPVAAQSGAKDAVEMDGRRGPADDGVALPSRSAAFEPMTEAKKKKLRKRADKINKSMPTFSSAGAGLSFGAVLTFALISWRVYRVVNGIRRAAGGPAVASAPGDFGQMFDPKVMALEIDKEVAESIKRPGAAEAREWLDAAKHPEHLVFEMGNDSARALVAGFYERGAVKVWVLDTDTMGNQVVTTTIAVELPKDAASRQKCLAFEVQYLNGEEPTKDFGQKYLQINTE